MLVKLHPKPGARCLVPLRVWQRLITGTVLLMVVIISVALLVLQPGTRTFSAADTAIPATTDTPVPVLPPGAEVYSFGGQWKPLDQQP
jgi:hypothetical protein